VFPNIVSINVLGFPTESNANVQGFRRINAATDRWNA